MAKEKQIFKKPPNPLNRGNINNVPNEALTFLGTFKYNREIAQIAKDLRKNQTIAEKYLWNNILRSSKTGYKFIRQKTIDKFILDFYCSELLIGIEVDGEIHNLQQEQDQIRSEYLEELGIKIIRFKNEEVLNEIKNTKNKLEDFIKSREIELQEKSSLKTPPVKGVGGFLKETFI